MTTGSRELLVLRHAQAVGVGASDHDRELTDRGRRQARAVGTWAADHDRLPDTVLVSSAARAVSTWREFAAGAGIEVGAAIDGALYSADVDSVLLAVRALPATARRALVVGHNPTMASLVQQLDDGTGAPAVFEAISVGYPTATLTVLELDGDWADAGAATARLVDVDTDSHHTP